MLTILARRRRRGAIPLKSPRFPAWLAGVLLVIALMAASAAAATWMALQIVPALQHAEMRQAEMAAFDAGRISAYTELSEAMGQVYDQGKQDALAALRERGQR